MPGTEPGHDIATLVRRLTLAGWLLLAGEIGFVLFQLERVRTVDGTRFATEWSQRIEVLGFMTLPPNLVALAPAAAVAVIATFLAGRNRDPWLETLLRVVAGTAIAMFFIAIVAIIEIISRAGDVELDSVFLRVGGMGLAAGMAVLCRTADSGS